MVGPIPVAVGDEDEIHVVADILKSITHLRGVFEYGCKAFGGVPMFIPHLDDAKSLDEVDGHA